MAADVLLRRSRSLEIVHSVGRKPNGYGWRLLPSGGSEDRPEVFHVQFDPATEDVTQVVVQAVAVIHNVEPVNLGSLGETVDTVALEAILEPRSVPGETTVTFAYENLEITVTNGGHVWLEWQ